MYDVPERRVGARLSGISNRLVVPRRERHPLKRRKCGAKADARAPLNRRAEQQHPALSQSSLVWRDRRSICLDTHKTFLKKCKAIQLETHSCNLSIHKLIMKDTFARTKQKIDGWTTIKKYMIYVRNTTCVPMVQYVGGSNFSWYGQITLNLRPHLNKMLNVLTNSVSVVI